MSHLLEPLPVIMAALMACLLIVKLLLLWCREDWR